MAGGRALRTTVIGARLSGGRATCAPFPPCVPLCGEVWGEWVGGRAPPGPPPAPTRPHDRNRLLPISIALLSGRNLRIPGSGGRGGDSRHVEPYPAPMRVALCHPLRGPFCRAPQGCDGLPACLLCSPCIRRPSAKPPLPANGGELAGGPSHPLQSLRRAHASRSAKSLFQLARQGHHGGGGRVSDHQLRDLGHWRYFPRFRGL